LSLAVSRLPGSPIGGGMINAALAVMNAIQKVVVFILASR
jgi:hypothetical protein